MSRGERILEAEGRRWRAVEAWRAGSGLGLLYFLPLDGEDVAEDDREDRRAALEPDETVGGLDEEELRERLGRATALTVTERRFRAPDGRPWLAQSVGPVWADGVASGLTGLLFTALEGAAERASVDGGHAGEMSEGELADRWRRAVETSGEDDGDGGDGPATTARSATEAEG